MQNYPILKEVMSKEKEKNPYLFSDTELHWYGASRSFCCQISSVADKLMELSEGQWLDKSKRRQEVEKYSSKKQRVSFSPRVQHGLHIIWNCTTGTGALHSVLLHLIKRNIIQSDQFRAIEWVAEWGIGKRSLGSDMHREMADPPTLAAKIGYHTTTALLS